MTEYLIGVALVLVLAQSCGLFAIARSANATDRMLAAQLVGTSGTGILILLGVALSQTGLLDAALALVVLAPSALITFISLCAQTKAP